MTAAPDFESFSRIYDQGRAQAVYRKLVADLETPVSAYLKLASDGKKESRENAFLFESVQGGEARGRYSIIALNPDLIWRCRGGKCEINRGARANPDAFVPDALADHPLQSLRALHDETRMALPAGLPPMAVGLYGYLGYDMVRLVENLPNPPADRLGLPDAILTRPTITAIFDSVRDEITIVTPVWPRKGVAARPAYVQAEERLQEIVDLLESPLPVSPGAEAPPAAMATGPIESNMTKAEYLDVVARAKRYIQAGDIFQVVPSQRFRRDFTLPPFALYRALRRLNPSPYLYYLSLPGFAVVGSSPEILVRLRGGKVTIRPIAGTRPRGHDAARDNALAAATTDNLVFLMAAAAAHNSGVSNANYGFPKHMWMTKFTKTTNDYFQWDVSLAAGATYHVWALLNSRVAVPLSLSVEGQTAALDFTTRKIGWDKLDAGVINIPAGAHILKLTGNSGVSGNIDIKSLELLRESDRPAYETRITNFKRYPSWFSHAKYGLMLQYGPWGYPKTGDHKSLEDFANGFDVPRFVNMVKGTGASYVIWSISLITYQLVAPIKSVNDIMGNQKLTSTRDLIGEIAAGLQSNGIHFCLYYHSGLNQQPDWLAKQNWPATFSQTATGDKSVFFDNWVSVISEIGNRYGTNLDGWFFDDACNYYPAPFERLGAAARAGNPNRMVSWNAWVAARYTDFQDVLFGEGYHGENQFGSSSIGGNGVFTDGPQIGLMGHGMFTMEGSWGIGRRNSKITTQINLNQALGWMKNASAHGVPLSFCMEMWEDQSYAQTTMDIFTALDSTVASHPLFTIKNNTDGDIKYSGAWTVASGRNAGDYKDDVNSTESNGDAFEFSFTGTGVDYIAPKDTTGGSVDIYVDNVFKQTVNASAATNQPMQTLFGIKGLANGSHTIKGIKKDGSSMSVDAFAVCNPQVRN